jgi:hypothetical protein
MDRLHLAHLGWYGLLSAYLGLSPTSSSAATYQRAAAMHRPLALSTPGSRVAWPPPFPYPKRHHPIASLLKTEGFNGIHHRSPSSLLPDCSANRRPTYKRRPSAHPSSPAPISAPNITFPCSGMPSRWGHKVTAARHCRWPFSASPPSSHPRGEDPLDALSLFKPLRWGFPMGTGLPVPLRWVPCSRRLLVHGGRVNTTVHQVHGSMNPVFRISLSKINPKSCKSQWLCKLTLEL